ncbi:DUF3147 family protein [Actinoallomurus iriomotensis]|uniref:DUF3147 family protein n=1 Tax=Actinoallomurus iriomotensis TaxID=478107 RepID=A0A9W6VZG4_9ACTN|nr:DUF3147 family protein [Actinoallomurus iriomotensis]GLY85329.1 hypothetical protein Airi02_032580 [Actinoallomurus iriomotensis]
MSTGRPGAPRVTVKLGRLRDVRAKALLVRFAFGAAVSAVAGVVSAVFGPRAGGVFLAFPAILLASLTLVAKEQNLRAARDDARGAAIGAVGMVTFAVVCALSAVAVGGPLALAMATLAWVLVSVAGYLLVRRLGHGADE